MARPASRSAGIGFDAKQEIRADEQPLERRADSRFETAIRAPFLVETKQGLYVFRRH